MNNLAHITPDLPYEAKKRIRDWRAEGKFNNAFYRVIQQKPLTQCRNCADAGFIMVSFTRAGPFENVPNHRKNETITWFDGNEKAGKGWYIISQTRSYDCQHCERSKKMADEPKAPPMDPELVQVHMKETIKELAKESYLHE